MNRVKSMSISFERTNWVNNSAPAITAAQLNRMEKGISDCVEAYNTIPTVYKFKGTLEYFFDLPTDNNEIGDVYNILDDGYNYAWNGESWEFLNISINITPFTEDYILERGTKEVDGVTWTYEKWNSGTAHLWGMITVTYTSAYLLQKTDIKFPFEFAAAPMGFPAINQWFNVSSSAYILAPNILCKTDLCTVQVRGNTGDFTQDTTLNVAVEIVGRWK